VLLVIICSALISRFKGIGIKTANGQYIGYSEQGDEWLFFNYQNIPVRQDGPYVIHENGKNQAIYIKGDGITSSKVYMKKVFNEIEVSVDNDVNTQFSVPLRKNYQRSKLVVPNPEKLFAISDLEGEFDSMVDLLQVNGVIDNSLNWSYESGHLVLIGDMVDRGDNVVPLLWLIYKLEGEAKLAGGEVHYILGNHERYLLDGRTKSVSKKYYGTYRTTGMSQRELWSENSELGRWLRSKPVMQKIGNTLFLHAGISPEILNMNPTLQSVDKEAEKKFVIGDEKRRTINGSVIHDANGIIFYRGLARGNSKSNLDENASNEHVEKILKQFQVDKIAIGHTLAKHIGYDYNGKIIRVDVNHSGGISEGLFIENDSLWRVDNKGNKFMLEQANNFD